jgi:hypothetical protein
MMRMTQSISLALIGSSLILTGCYSSPAPTAEDKEKEQPAPGVATGGHYVGGHYRPVYIPGPRTSAGSGGHGAAIHSPSHSGGFGSSAHAVGS